MCIRDRCTSTLTDWPWTVAINLSFFTSLVMYFPDATWYVSILVSSFLSCNKLSNAPKGSFANAASVGAKTVNGPGPLSVSTRSAACTAFTSGVEFSASIAVSTIFFIFFFLSFIAIFLYRLFHLSQLLAAYTLKTRLYTRTLWQQRMIY